MKNKIKKCRSNAGFSLVELLTVMAILAILIIVSTGPLASIYHARAKAVATELNALITECKINNLSGMDSRLEVVFDEDEKAYKCSFIYNGKQKNGVEYKTEYIGSERSELTVNETYSLKTDKLIIAFSNKTGAVTQFKCGSADLTSRSTNTINITSNRSYDIVVYKLTGKQDVGEVTEAAS